VFQLFVFVPGPLAGDVPMDAARFGLPPGEVMKHVEVRDIPRGADPAWFDGFRSGALRNIAREQLQALAPLDAAQRVVAVLISRPDADDLAHLQAGWAVGQWLVARGATVLLDAQANRFWRGEEVADWPPARPFALSSDVNLIVEGEPTAPSARIHTRGMQKFGRTDLVVEDVPASRWDAVAGLLRALAHQLADGVVYRPGQRVTVDGHDVGFEDFRPTPQTDLHLNNAALVVTA
jgi:hypothetical protein